jgi:hypothetical protein
MGMNTACVVRAGGTVSCWGYWNGGSFNSPVGLAGMTGIGKVAVGYAHVCGVTTAGKVLCTGDNAQGQLGNGTTDPQVGGVEVVGLTDAKDVAASYDSSCARKTSGEVLCWGGGVTSPSAVANVAAISISGSGHTGFAAVRQNGTVTHWPSFPPWVAVNIAGMSNVSRVAVGADLYTGNPEVCGIRTDQSAICNGRNMNGLFGAGVCSDGTSEWWTPSLAHEGPATQVKTITFYHSGQSTLLQTSGKLYCSGASNSYGLGDGQQFPPAGHVTFVPVVGLLPVGSEHGQCFDGIDNDGNGKADLEDTACAEHLGTVTGAPVKSFLWDYTEGNYLSQSCNPSNSTWGSRERVFRWQAPSAGTYQFDTAGSTLNTVLAAYAGNPETSAELACNDDGPGSMNGSSSFSVTLGAGETITLVVDSQLGYDFLCQPYLTSLSIQKQ